jgi:hypothetical protein
LILADTHLFVTNGELALRLLVVLGIGLELLDGLVLQHGDAKLDVCLGVFVAGLCLTCHVLSVDRKDMFHGLSTHVNLGIVG